MSVETDMIAAVNAAEAAAVHLAAAFGRYQPPPIEARASPRNRHNHDPEASGESTERRGRSVSASGSGVCALHSRALAETSTRFQVGVQVGDVGVKRVRHHRHRGERPLILAPRRVAGY